MQIITFKTMTAAQYAASILKSAGIAASVTGVDPNITKRGCSFGLSIARSDSRRATDILTRRRIQYGDLIG